MKVGRGKRIQRKERKKGRGNINSRIPGRENKEWKRSRSGVREKGEIDGR